jgi:hypothetical protein
MHGTTNSNMKSFGVSLSHARRIDGHFVCIESFLQKYISFINFMQVPFVVEKILDYLQANGNSNMYYEL